MESLRSSFHRIATAKNINPSPTQKSYVGLKVEIPKGSFYTVTALAMYNNSSAQWIGINEDSEEAPVGSCYVNAATGLNHASVTASGYAEEDKTLYIWGQWSGATSNTVSVHGFYVKL